MKAQKFFGLVLILALLAALNVTTVTSFAQPGFLRQAQDRLPDPGPERGFDNSLGAIWDSPGPPEIPATTRAKVSQAQQPIIIDHTCTDLNKIPDVVSGYESITRTAALIANAYTVYLPLVLR